MAEAVNLFELRTQDYYDNEAQVGPHEPCMVCGRAIKNRGRATYYEINTSGEVLPEGDPRSGGPESQGGFPVGDRCRRRHRLKERTGH